MGRLSEAAQDAVRVAAVAGREFDFDLLKGAWGKGEEATLAALDDLLRHRLIGEATAGADYAFTHHKIQEVVYEGLPRHRRLHLHGQVGTAMERWLGVEAEARAVELAYHFEQARQLDGRLTDKAIAYLLQGPAGPAAVRQSGGAGVLPAKPGYRPHPAGDARAPTAGDRAANGLAVPTTVVHGYVFAEPGRCMIGPASYAASSATRPLGSPPSRGCHATTVCRAI